MGGHFFLPESGNLSTCWQGVCWDSPPARCLPGVSMSTALSIFIRTVGSPPGALLCAYDTSPSRSGGVRMTLLAIASSAVT
jgi:hypothetical protein